MAAVEKSIVTNIAEMIDLAIGTPEVGVVDFCMLQTVLHCLAQQLGVKEKNVELRGSIASFPVGRQSDDGITIAIDEYLLETDGKSAGSPEEQDTMLIVQRVTKEKEASMSTKGGKMGPPQQTKAKAQRKNRQSEATTGASSAPPIATPSAVVTGAPSTTLNVTSVEAISGDQEEPKVSGGVKDGSKSVTMGPRLTSSTEKLSLVTISKFNLLESTVEDLKNRVYGSLPKNEEILQEVRSQTNLKAITDMWTSLNVSSRLEAAEEGISKLSSLVQDIIAETPNRGPPAGPTTAQTDARDEAATGQINQEKTESDAPMAPGQSMVLPPGMTATSGNIRFAQSGVVSDSAMPADVSNLMSVLKNLRTDHDNLSDAFNRALKELNIKVERPPSASLPSAVSTISGAQSRVNQQGSDPGTTQKIVLLTKKLEALEEKLRQCCDNVAASCALQDQVNSLQDQMEHYSKSALTSAGPQISPNLAKDLQGLMQLYQTVQEMQGQLQQVHDTAIQLAAEKDNRQHNINSLLEQIELLKIIKLDREDMVEALAEKADLRMLTRKVSHDQFEMACDDLSKGLEHAIGKLNVQESLWQQALDDIQREIETKLDKMELSPVKEFFNSKLKQLQENLKQMAALRREAEAAGTKKRLLTNVNCISCDAKAVMSMEPSAPGTSSKGLPPSMSMKPYLSYELDAIRKTQASNLPQRNMHDWEHIDKQMTLPKQPQKVRSETDKHLCNRYCGGSHTTTTPAQRVARLGHFIKQWGPEVLPLSSGFATGDDGRLYKVSTVEAANCGPGGAVDAPCTPKNAKKIENKPQKSPPHPECRCLEEKQTKK